MPDLRGQYFAYLSSFDSVLGLDFIKFFLILAYLMTHHFQRLLKLTLVYWLRPFSALNHMIFNFALELLLLQAQMVHRSFHGF